jgi:hypothetical protein
MPFADPPPAPPVPEAMIVSSQDASVVVTGQDTPLVLVKGPRREQAMLRHAVFLTRQVSVMRPVGEATAAKDRYRWTFKGYLQRQVCFTSLTGLFACTAGETAPLAEAETGEAALEAGTAGFPLADAAQARVSAGLAARAQAVFEADRRMHFDAVLKAAGVVAAGPAARRTAGGAVKRR